MLTDKMLLQRAKQAGMRMFLRLSRNPDLVDINTAVIALWIFTADEMEAMRDVLRESDHPLVQQIWAQMSEDLEMKRAA